MRITFFAATMCAASAITVSSQQEKLTEDQYDQHLKKWQATTIPFRTPEMLYNAMFNQDFDLFKHWLTRFEGGETSIYETNPERAEEQWNWLVAQKAVGVSIGGVDVEGNESWYGQDKIYDFDELTFWLMNTVTLPYWVSSGYEGLGQEQFG